MSGDSGARVLDRDPRSVQRRFMALNAARLRRTRDILRPRQREFMTLLPLLFEVNHPLLPGYVNRVAPAGIAGYQPDDAALNLARRNAKSFQYRRRGADAPQLLAIYLMGSPGSVAFSSGSDMDIWLCFGSELGEEALELLQQKARRIEQWAAELELEVHFFPVDVERFRRGELTDLSSESSGTAQHSLLLDEFYRTGILVAGRYPLWWLVPPEREADYAEYVAELQAKRFLHVGEGVDFGGLPRVPPEEFFGASLWQLSKGIDSPYKSALKLMLIEAYASEHPDIDLLSHRLKRAVYDGDANPERLDPYLMMLDKVQRYLLAQEDSQRLELARRCFYIKVDERLSEPERGPVDWRRMLIGATVGGWGWSAPDFVLMDARDQWSVPRVAEERRILFEALTASYQFLSDFARRYAGVARISQRDLTVLGRKLYAAFERKAGKVELLNRGIVCDLRRERLSLHEIRDSRGPGWLLYHGAVGGEALRREQPIKRSRSIVELAAWGYFNRVLDRDSAIALHPQVTGFNGNDLATLLDGLRGHFPAELLATGEMEDYAEPARITRCGLFVNMGVPHFERAALVRDSGSSGSFDALSYGVTRESLLLSVDQVLVTSWHEVMHRRYLGHKGLMECLVDYLKWHPRRQDTPDDAIKAFGLGSERGMTVARRVEELFGDVIDCFYGGQNPPQPRYVVAAATGYYVISGRGDGFGYKWLADQRALLEYLGQAQERFSPVRVDRHALGDSLLPAMCAHNKPGRVQLYFRHGREEAEVYVFDERGSLFYQRLPFYSEAMLLNQYSLFFEASLNRMQFLMQEGDGLSVPSAVEFYSLERDAVGRPRLDRKAPEFSRGRAYMSLQVLADQDEAGRPVFTLYCDDREFTNLEYGNDLFQAVARYILEQRRSGDAYPIYITDISIGRPLLGDGSLHRVQTSLFLKYKRRIEDQLNRALAKLRG